jgi:hypothetical protein
MVRERDGNSVRADFNSESQAASLVRACVAKRMVSHADVALSRDHLHVRFEVKGIVDPEAYSLDGSCTDVAADDFNRPHRAEIGIDHDVAGSNLFRRAQASSWREGGCLASNKDRVSRLQRLH